MFKVNNKNTRTTPLALLLILSIFHTLLYPLGQVGGVRNSHAYLEFYIIRGALLDDSNISVELKREVLSYSQLFYLLVRNWLVARLKFYDFIITVNVVPQLAVTYSKLTIEILEQGVCNMVIVNKKDTSMTRLASFWYFYF